MDYQSVLRKLRKIFPIILEEFSAELAVKLMKYSLQLGLCLEISDVSEFGFIYWALDSLTQLNISLVLKNDKTALKKSIEK
jgi:hypothetical protein